MSSGAGCSIKRNYSLSFVPVKSGMEGSVGSDKTRFGVNRQLVACVDDVEVAHSELADTVGSGEHRVSLLHCETFRFVCEVRRTGVEDGVVIAAAQFEIDFTGDGSGNPALSGFAKHDGLRVKPAALVKQTAESETVDAPLLNRVFVMNTGHKTIKRNVKKRHSRGFIDAAALRFNNTVFNLIAHAQTVTAANAVGFKHEFNLVIKHFSVERDRDAFFKANGHFFGFDVAVFTPERNTHDRVNNLDAAVQMLQILGFVCRAEHVGVGRISFFLAHLVAEAVVGKELAHFGSAARAR